VGAKIKSKNFGEGSRKTLLFESRALHFNSSFWNSTFWIQVKTKDVTAPVQIPLRRARPRTPIWWDLRGPILLEGTPVLLFPTVDPIWPLARSRGLRGVLWTWWSHFSSGALGFKGRSRRRAVIRVFTAPSWWHRRIVDGRLSYQSSYGFASRQIPCCSQGTLLPSSGEPKVSNSWNNMQRKDSI
jgi:hypothetical protein